MTPPTNHEREKAEKILGPFEVLWNDRTGNVSAHDQLIDDIAQALASHSRPPPNHIRLEDGRDVRVLGSLPLTKDGCLIGDDCKVWTEGEYVNV